MVKINKDECIKLHFEEDWTYEELAKIYNCNKVTIKRRFISWGFKYIPMQKIDILTQDILKEAVTYNEKTGVFTAKIRRSNCRVGDILGSYNNGYIEFSLYGKIYKAHRLAWLYIYGKWPQDQLDHIDHIRYHNWISNLREVSNKENAKNRKNNENSNSGILGVYKSGNKWRATITVDYKMIKLGSFNNINDAKNARIEAENKFGFHKNHGK